MRSQYRDAEKTKAVQLIKDGFFGGKGGGKYRKNERDGRDFILLDGKNNLFDEIVEDVLEYFRQNNISWWGGKSPTGHVLSSQIACLNHLFAIRHDKRAVLEIARAVDSEFMEVFEIESDKSGTRGYIQFEAVSVGSYLNEGPSRRGINCTSIDALIHAGKQGGSKWLLPIEWKYTECYGNQNKALEGFKKDPVKYKGKERRDRYTDLIKQSAQLKDNENDFYYFEPFYQLMRQTLWAERMIENKEKESVQADDFLHVHVVPGGNTDLLAKKYPCGNGRNMEDAWRSQLREPSKYRLFTPESLLAGLTGYEKLVQYLRKRYWSQNEKL